MKYKLCSRLSGFGLSLPGSYHLALGRTCEDASCVKVISAKRGRYLLMVCADGVSQCRFGGIASHTAVHAAVRSIENALVGGARPDKRLLWRAFQSAVKALWQKAAEMGMDNLEELGTTLDAVLLDEKGRLLLAHNGDGGLLILTSSGQIATTGKMNEGGGVFTVDWHDSKGQPMWYITEMQDAAGCVMMTDGLYDYLTEGGKLDGEFFLENDVFGGWSRRNRAAKKAEALKRYLLSLRDEQGAITDDITITVGVRPWPAGRAARRAGLA